MKYAIIDIGSNSIRMTVYQINGSRFQTLFRAGEMAGLAGYVEVGRLSQDGIRAAEAALLEFREVLQSLSIENVSVFATASLRNVINTQEAAAMLKQQTGFEIAVISAEEEAAMSYQGAMMELHIANGAFADIGGASTEILAFEKGVMTCSASCRLGSLSLYKRCVEKILPGRKAVIRMSKVLDEEVAKLGNFRFDPRTPLVCVGGTARAALKLAKKIYNLPEGTREVTAEQIDEMVSRLLRNEKKTCRLLLRLEPDRIHTIIPGLFILQRILHLYEAREIVVSKYGVREGFLCKKIMEPQTAGTLSPKTGS